MDVDLVVLSSAMTSMEKGAVPVANGISVGETFSMGA